MQAHDPAPRRTPQTGIMRALALLAAALLVSSACGGGAKTPQTRKPAGPANAVRSVVDPEANSPQPAPRPSSKTKKKAAPPLPDASTIPMLDASRLPLEPPPLADAPQRNLFAFEEDPVVVAKRKKDAEDAALRAAEAQRLAAIEAAKRAAELAANPPPPQPPPIPFEFVGYFGDPKKRIGVFAPKGGGETTLALEGEKIFGTFHVKEIGFESAEIGYDNFKETKRIPISATSGGK